MKFERRKIDRDDHEDGMHYNWRRDGLIAGEFYQDRKEKIPVMAVLISQQGMLKALNDLPGDKQRQVIETFFGELTEQLLEQLDERKSKKDKENIFSEVLKKSPKKWWDNDKNIDKSMSHEEILEIVKEILND